MSDITKRIAEAIGARPAQVAAAVDLLDGGATVPFIARYRKEATGGLDDTQLRGLEERLAYLRELEARRETVIRAIDDQGKLSAELESKLRAAETKTALEDLYLPYRPKRRTKAQTAREAGLEPLADAVAAPGARDPETLAQAYVDPARGVADAQAALEGARHILTERLSEDAALLGRLRDLLRGHGVLRARPAPNADEDAAAKYRDYLEHREPFARIPSHRALALLRARNEGVLFLELTLENKAGEPDDGAAEALVHAALGVDAHRGPARVWLARTARQAWRARLSLKLQLDLLAELRERAETEAIRVFAANFKDLLLAAPAGARTVMGLDPGLRTGVKVAVVDATGKVVATATVYPHAPHKRWNEALELLARLVDRQGVDLVAIGNGTASRETQRLAAELARRRPGLRHQVVSESGASVYSASRLAADELPELDVSLRGAVSIARRLQDPLAELVKIEPKAIGVGQYQHDVNQSQLGRTLDAVVEDCVNAVGVDLNTASAALLAHVSGLSGALAERIVAHRNARGAFPDRKALMQVQRLGAKTFEQAAGFLRIRGGDNPLDASAVHPEAYPVVERMLAAAGEPLERLMGRRERLRRLAPADFTDERFGLATVRDILAELEKPGRDPRPEFRTARFAEGVETLDDLKPGMTLEGVVSNVANFGAFVDIGVHQDGLVHVSELADRFVKDPRAVVKAGDIVQVRVLDVDRPRKRIALSMRSDSQHPTPAAADNRGRGQRPKSSPQGGMADALERALKGR